MYYPPLKNNIVAFKSEPLEERDVNYSKENNVVILGSSYLRPSVEPKLSKVGNIVSRIVQLGGNILTGNGRYGIMGKAYYKAAKFSEKDEDGKPIQNITIVKEPHWGQEDLENCVVIDTANSAADMTEKFVENADSFVIFPGGPATLTEAVTLITRNHSYQDDMRKIVLVGKKYFAGIDEQFKTIYDYGFLTCKPEELYTIVDDAESALDIVC